MLENSATNYPTTSANYDFPVSDFSVDENRPYCRALYNFQGEYENELSFLTGDIIYLTAKLNEEWLEGESQNSGLTGIFPNTFVEIVVDLGEANAVLDDAPSQTFIQHLSTTGVASVLHDFTGRYEDELSAKAADSLKVLEIIDENWVRCQNLSNGEEGIVPQAFLQIFLDNERSSFISNNSTRQLRDCEEVKQVSWNDEVITWEQGKQDKAGAKESFSPRLPAVQPFNVLDFEAFDSGKVEKKKRPPRPPPPKDAHPQKHALLKKIDYSKDSSNNDLSMSLHSFQQPNVSGNAGVLMTSSISLKEKVVQDLLSTEITYLFDLDTWEASITQCSLLDEPNKQILTNGLPLLKALSQKLIDKLNFEKSKPAELQCYGLMFMEMKEHFFTTFSCHCRCVEQISQILENNVDCSLQEALNKCLSEMRRMGSNVFEIETFMLFSFDRFDVPTAVSRPIQRCLKYPLYVGEILKNTAINHIDHPKLMESLKQLGNLASKMNECKRRKELIKKYKGDQQLTLTERISRINIHSLVKKSNRLKYRISSSIGLNNIKDSEFDYLISLLDAAERRVCKLLYCAQLYKKNIEFSSKKHEESYKGVCPPQDEEALKAFAKMFRELDKFSKHYRQLFETSIINEGKELLKREYTKLIHKRCDKLADYENAIATNKNLEEVEMRRNEYEALNNQVKANLPKLVSTINKKVVNLVHKIHAFDKEFLQRMDKWFNEERSEKVRKLIPSAQPFEHFFTMVQKQRFVEIDKLLRFKTMVKESNKNSFDGSLRPGHASKSPAIMMGTRTQTVKERDALIKIMKAQQRTEDLRRVRVEFNTEKIKLAANDIVIVKEHRLGTCLCDNGVSLEYVPLDCLMPYDNTFYPSYRPTSLPSLIDLSSMENGVNSLSAQSDYQFSSPIQTRPDAANKKKKLTDDNLIDLEESLIDLSSPEQQQRASKQVHTSGLDPFEDVFKLVHYEQEPRSARKDSTTLPTSLFTKSTQPNQLKDTCHNVPYSSREDPFAELFRTAIETPLSKIKRESPEIPRRPDSECSLPINQQQSKEELRTVAPPLIPVRLAPLPPLPQAVKNTDVSASPTNTFHAAFDFSPESEDTNQIAINEGETIEVQQKHDDAGNVEWWLVKRGNGQSGYVPAAYLLQTN